MRTQRSSFENSSLRKSRSHGSFVKKGALAAAVALCCMVGVGTAVAATASPQDGTSAPADAHAAVQTLAADEVSGAAAGQDTSTPRATAVSADGHQGVSQTLAAGVTPLADYPATTVTYNLNSTAYDTLVLNLNITAGYTVTVDWGDPEMPGYTTSSNGSGGDWQFTYGLDGGYGYDLTLTIYANTTSTNVQAYTLGGGTSSLPFFGSGCARYLTSVTTAPNAGVQPYSFYGTGTGSYPLFITADFSECNTTGVTDMSSMFSACAALETLDLSGFDTTSVTDMSSMFAGCSSLPTLDLSGFDTSTTASKSSMFDDCTSLYEIVLGKAFELVPSENSLPTPSFTKPYVATGTWQYLLADGTLDGTRYAASEVTKKAGDPEITWRASESDVSTAVTFNLSSAGSSLRPTLNLYVYEGASVGISWGDGTSQSVTGSGNQTVTKDSSYATAGVYTVSITSEFDDGPAYLLGQGGDSSGAFVDSSYWPYLVSVKTAANAGVQSYSFYGTNTGSYPLFTTADFSKCNTSGVTNMSYLFRYCYHIASLDVSGFDTSQVTNMSYMFSACSGSLSSLDVSGFDTSKVTNMSHMFDDCRGLNSLDLSSWDVGSLHTTEDMFYYCNHLVTLDLSGWQFDSGSKNFDYMFYHCDELESLDLSGWDCPNIQHMVQMFFACYALTSLDLSGLATNIEEGSSEMDYMFDYANALRKVTYGKDYIFATSGFNFPFCLPSPSFDSPYTLPTLVTWTLIDTDTGQIGETYEARELFDHHNEAGATETYYATAADPDNVKFTAEDFDVDLTATLDLAGQSIYPQITTELLEGTEYAVSYSPSDPGSWTIGSTVTMTISGRGNYENSTALTYTLTLEGAQAQITASMFTVDTANKPYTGSPITPSVTPTTGLVQDRDYTVSYTSNTDAGTASITIQGIGNYTGTLTYYFTIEKATATPSNIPDVFEATYGDTLADLDLSTYNDTSGTWAWADGSASVGNAGDQNSFTAVYTPNDTANYEAVTATVTVTVSARTLSYDMFVVDTASALYHDGDAITKEITGSYNGAALVLDTDYTVVYTGNVHVGTATITVTGKGNFTGELTYSFKITEEPLTYEMFTVDLSEETYTGSEITKEIVTSLPAEDYEVAYSDNVNVGEATITITGHADYAGTLIYTFDIVAASLQQDWFTVTPASTVYTGDVIDVTVTNTEGLEADTDYTWSVVPEEVKDAGTYTVTVTGSGNYTGDVELTFTVATAELQQDWFTVTASSTTYTGEDISVTVENSAGLTEDTDYTWSVEPEEVKAAGTYTVTVTGEGSCTGDLEYTFEIAKAALEEGWFSVTPSSSVYTGEDISVTVENSAGLTEESDYTWAVEPDPVHDAGSYTVTVTGCGNWDGTFTYDFTIEKASLQQEWFTVTPSSSTYTGDVISVTVENSEGLEVDIDYTWSVEPEEVKAAGTYTVTVSGCGNYTGDLTYTFDIVAASLQQDWFGVTPSSSIYTGDVIDVTVENTQGLTYDTDYTWSVEPEEVKAAGAYTVTVTGCGNWDGTFTYDFTIEKAAAAPERTPAALTAVYGQTLSDLDLSAYDDDAGFWSWADEDTTPVGSAGSTYTFTAIYTPYDTDNFEPVTAEVAVTVLVKGLEQAWFTVTPSSTVYTGSDIDVTVENTQGLVFGTDYTWAVEPDPVHDAGSYVVTVTGCGDYADSFLTYAFTIAPVTAELAWVDVNHPDADATDGLISYVYDGTASDIVATISNLIAGDECAVSVAGGTQGAAGTHMATAVELSNANYALPAYASCLYYIEHATLTEDMFAIDTDDVAYNGEEIKPELTSPAGLEEGVDYSIAYTDNTAVGTASVTVTGIGNYTGKVVFHFRIVQAVAEPEKTPADLTATYGDKLAVVSLEEFADDNGSWAWAAEDPDQTYVGDAGESLFVAVYTPNDDADYAPCYADVTISVAPHPLEGMEFTVADTEQEYTGYAVYASVTGPADVVTGEPMAEGTDFTVAYYAEDDPTTAVEPRGVGEYAFTISGAGNYTGELADASYTLTVTKASPSIDLPPANLTATYGEALSDVILPRSDESEESWGWSWDEAYFEDEDIDETGHFTSAGTHAYYALFTPEDSVDYESYDEPLEIEVLPRSVELTWEDGAYEDMNRVYDAQASDVTAAVDEDSLVNGDSAMDVTVEGGDAVDAGAHVAVATALADENYTLDGSASATCAYFIEHASAVVVPNDASKTYGDTEPTLDGQVEGLCEGDTLGEVSYTRADGEDVGTYAITAACEDANPNYSVTYERGTLTINRASIAEMDWAIDEEQAVYSGEAIEKRVTAPDDLVKTDTPLAEGTDYTCTYFNNTDAGTATLAVTGAGNYTGVWMTTFTIAKATPTYTEPANLTAVYGQTLGEIALTDGWTWDEGEAASVGDAGTRTHKATYTPEDTANYETVTGIELTVTVSPKSIEQATFTLSPEKATYTGEPITVSVFGHDGTTYLDPTSDYTVAYYATDANGDKTGDPLTGNPTDVGTYAVVISGTGNYSGEATLKFEIVAAPVSGTTLTKSMFTVDTADATYTGGAIEPSVTSATLSAGTDYEVAYTHNADVGTAIVTISGKGEYAGELTYTFEIVPAGLTAEMFTIEEGDATYTGHQVVREIGGTYNGAALVEGSDYSVSYADNVDAGTASVTVTGHGNYTGTATLTFEIAPATITEAMFTVDTDDATYTGEPITKSVSSEDLAGHDYTVAYENNTDIGTATITIAGTGNYTGEITYTFEIVAAPETGKPDTGGEGTPKVGDTFEYDGGQYTVTSSTTATYNWPLPTTTKANVATTIVRGGRSLAVTAIDKNAFKGNKRLTVIKVGDNVKKIPDKAFSKCTKVTKINLGTGVKTVGKQACANMKKLKKATFKSKTLKQIGAKCFKGDKKLKTVTIKSTKLKKIGASAFKGCNKLKTLVIKSTKLSSKNITKALKGSKIKTIKLTFATSSTKKLHKKLVKRYTKAFSKSGSGNKVTVK